jgi:hypothetical protein
MGPSVWGRLVNKQSRTDKLAAAREPVHSIGTAANEIAKPSNREELTKKKKDSLAELLKERKQAEILGIENFRLISVLGRGSNIKLDLNKIFLRTFWEGHSLTVQRNRRLLCKKN